MKSQFLNTSFLIHCEMKWEICIQSTSTYQSMMVASRKSTHLSANCISHFFPIKISFFTWMSINLYQVFGRLFFFLKINKVSLSLQGSNKQYLLPMINSEISNKCQNFGNLVSTLIKSDSFPTLVVILLFFKKYIV